ncbi:transmembrane protein 132E isoform X2 [Sorex fumeus]|uniref:transmembrane protein 132E isoform X2 n=1 Tax=Sorex fumeus TaxID=62283 RepID=UPI0024AD3F64|nr:transmembrane protein 132E isoform X2 [Sorex fumeus]
MAPGMPGRGGAALLCLSALLAHASGRSHPASPSPPGPQASRVLPISYRLSHTRLAFFLREARPPPPTLANGSLQRSEPFVVFQTKELPVLNVSLGPFSTSQVVARELLQPSSTLDIPERLTVNWKVRAFIVQARVPASQPVAQVLFYVAGRDWDDFGVAERLPCVRLHAFRDAREVKSSCRLGGGLATCLVRAELPLAWFGPPAPASPPTARRKAPDGLEPEAAGESQQAELYYTLHAPDAAGGCGGSRRGPGAGLGARAESPTQHPLLRIGSISLFRPPPRRTLQEHRLDGNLMIRLPDRPLKPGEVLSILLYLAPNSSSPAGPSVEHFTLRVKAKKGVTLLGTKSRSGQWHVTSELLTGAKHSTATVDVSWAQGTPLPPWEGQGPLEILQLDFEMENFTSQSVKRRIMWHIDYRGHGALPDLERAVTELTVIQRDVQAILPLAMDTEIINTAILTGRTVAIPVKVIAIEVTGLVLDVSAFVECESDNEDIIKVSSSCDYVFVSGKETRGSMNARVTFRYDVLQAPLEMTVWVPKLPLHIELSDARLSQVKGWRVPILPDRRSARESEDEDEDEEERRQSASRGCTLQYQHATLQVFTQFHTTSSEGTGQVVPMLGPDWLVEVTDLVSDFLRVGDPRVARLVDSSTLAGLEPGTTPFKVVSPLTESVLGETLLTVTEEKVSITQLQAQVVASLALSLRPSPGSSHTILATTAAQQTLSFLKQPSGLWAAGEQPGRAGGQGDPGPGLPAGGGPGRGGRGTAPGRAQHRRELPEDQAQECAGHHPCGPARALWAGRGRPHLRLPGTQPARARRGRGRGAGSWAPRYGVPSAWGTRPGHRQPCRAAHGGHPAAAHWLPADAAGPDRPGDRHVRAAGRLLPGHPRLSHQLHRLRAALPPQAHPARGPDQHGPFPPLGVSGQRAAAAGAGRAVAARGQPVGDGARLLPWRPPQQRQLADQRPEPGAWAGGRLVGGLGPGPGRGPRQLAHLQAQAGQVFHLHHAALGGAGL